MSNTIIQATDRAGNSILHGPFSRLTISVLPGAIPQEELEGEVATPENALLESVAAKPANCVII
ncbi:MAG: hypothetical protein GXP08_01655 [Gammaproteobacteria bacterium]|nr:hypothetical protein [Gammaproteobacteria bacterium]